MLFSADSRGWGGERLTGVGRMGILAVSEKSPD